MSKYNHIKSIPIESIPREELSQAIKEWAEGYDFLERLLWSLYNNNLKTDGCHAGTKTYVGLVYEKEKPDELSVVLNASLAQKDSQVLMSPDGGNPLSGPDWYKPNIAVGAETPYEEDGKKFCDNVSEAIDNKKAESDLDLSSVITLLDFLIGKITCLDIRINHKNDDMYTFCIEGSFEENERFEEFNQLFTNAGLNYNKHPEFDRRYWTISSNNPKELSEKLKDIVSYIVDNYNIKTPDSLDEVSGLNSSAHVIRNQCLEDGNMAKFETWLMTEEEIINKRIEEIKKRRV